MGPRRGGVGDGVVGARLGAPPTIDATWTEIDGGSVGIRNLQTLCCLFDES
eukprot:m.94611 g.94611  ORF g.94611 m.94611 type:complete len:51 (+) comp12273_c0_seq1:820-972(+)